MFRKLMMVLVIAVLALIFVACEPGETDSGVSLFVAVDGDDANSGTIGKPFRTLV
jgi:hypothetical protein